MQISPTIAFLKSARNPVIDGMFNPLIKALTKDRYIAVLSKFKSTAACKALHEVLDIAGYRLDQKAGVTTELRKCLFGRQGIATKRSALAHLLCPVFRTNLDGWKRSREAGVPEITWSRVKQDIPPVWKGWKQLRDEICPNFKVKFDPATDHTVKILPDDTMTPKDRINNLVNFKDVDRVGVGFMLDQAMSFMGTQVSHDIGGLWQNKFGPGSMVAKTAINTWIRLGGLDFLPSISLPTFASPFMESHSAFYFDFAPPTDTLYEQFLEKELLPSYEQIYDWGLSGSAKAISTSVLNWILISVREVLKASLALSKYFTKPFTNLFESYAGSICSLWDIIPMARGFVPFIKDMKKCPQSIIEVFEFLEPGLTDLGLAIAKLTKAKYVLIGNSRGSSSWISPKMFEQIFWPSMKRTWEKILKAGYKVCAHLDNDWTGNMAYFLELPKHSGFFHLDQGNLAKVREIVGDHFCLMGNLQPAITTGAGPEVVYKHTKSLIETCGKDGGFIVATGCETPVNVPVANYYAAKRAIKDAGYFRR